MRKHREEISVRKIAAERIDILLNLAEKNLKEDVEISRRYVELARKIGMRYNVQLPREKKRWMCKKCNLLLKPGLNCRVRISGSGGISRLVICDRCGLARKFPISSQNKA